MSFSENLMYNRESKIGKQVLAWALVFALTLSVIPYSSADGETEEWFEDWYYDFEDRDEDDNSDLITIHVDPDTDSSNEVEVYIDWYVQNNTGDNIYSDGEYFDINGNETEYFGFEWGLEDCYYEDDACNAGPYTFYFTLLDDEWYQEDEFSISNITLSEMGMPNDVIQVDGGPLAWDDDEFHNDAVARALVLDYEVANVSYELEKSVQGVWIDAGNATTDDDGFAVIFNQTNGLYRWTAFYENEEIDSGEFVIQASSTSNIGNVGYFGDMDDDDDFDDFEFVTFEDNRTSDSGSYVEVFYESNNTLYESASSDNDGDGAEIITFFDVPEGNYTFKMYYEEDGNLIQKGWLHSYGSETDHVYYWFETHNYTTEDSNNDGVLNNVTITYNPDTSSQEEEEITVDIQVYDGENNGDFHSYEYEITGNETDDFETDVITVEKDGNYTFDVRLIADDWYVQDSFSFELYLECDEDFTECDADEWFEDWDYETEDTDGDNLEDTIGISYDPNTDCDCEMEIEVDVEVYENGTGDWIDNEYTYHTINGTEEEYFEAIDDIGVPCIVKPVMSSSGKGQSTVHSKNDAIKSWEYAKSGARGEANKVIVEGFIDFDYEITLLTIQHINGCSFCEPIGHRQEKGDYQESWQPQPMSEGAIKESQRIAELVTSKLGGKGVFGVELFIKGDDVYFSEVSPRPHDTGMVTLISQDLSQFALHTRAILDLPIPNINLRSPAASAVILVKGKSDSVSFHNLDKALEQEDTQIRLFGKPKVEGERRMGVALALGSDIAEARTKATSVANMIDCQL